MLLLYATSLLIYLKGFKMELKELIELYDLQPHPEGGYFKESYRAETKTSTPNGERNSSTAIYFLIPVGKKSALHRIASDEVWHFYLGAPLKIIQISPDGILSQVILGQDLKAGHKLQHVVPAGYWFGAISMNDRDYSFVGCTVAPGFDFNDFEIGQRSKLNEMFPHAKNIIELLTD
nr:cupin domain-containing protein [Pigmentibacter ruber]